jgi:protein SCO1/2
VQLQRQLPEALRRRVRFVSISLDPERDTPAALRAYALARGADFAGWSFLTGEPSRVASVLESYGVGTLREPNGEIEHVVVSFLIDAHGRIAKRYFGLDHPPDEYLRDLGGA